MLRFGHLVVLRSATHNIHSIDDLKRRSQFDSHHADQIVRFQQQQSLTIDLLVLEVFRIITATWQITNEFADFGHSPLVQLWSLVTVVRCSIGCRWGISAVGGHQWFDGLTGSRFVGHAQRLDIVRGRRWVWQSLKVIGIDFQFGIDWFADVHRNGLFHFGTRLCRFGANGRAEWLLLKLGLGVQFAAVFAWHKIRVVGWCIVAESDAFSCGWKIKVSKMIK